VRNRRARAPPAGRSFLQLRVWAPTARQSLGPTGPLTRAQNQVGLICVGRHRVRTTQSVPRRVTGRNRSPHPKAVGPGAEWCHRQAELGHQPDGRDNTARKSRRSRLVPTTPYKAYTARSNRCVRDLAAQKGPIGPAFSNHPSQIGPPRTPDICRTRYRCDRGRSRFVLDEAYGPLPAGEIERAKEWGAQLVWASVGRATKPVPNESKDQVEYRLYVRSPVS
jgi:hypothetical protein